MSDPSTVLYQMGEAVAEKVELGKTELLAGTNTWTGPSNTFNENVTIGDLAITDKTYGDVQLGDLSDFEAGLAS
jgi:hypothetical protein